MIEEYLAFYKRETPDICEHLDTLRNLAAECEHVTEFGFRYGASFCALLAGAPSKLVTYDISIPKAAVDLFESLKGETQIEFHEKSTLDIVIEPTDLLFIDTLHTYSQLIKELEKHGNKARKYLAFHDTETYAFKGEDGSEKGLRHAINEFMDVNAGWRVFADHKNNNGLLILTRV